MGVGAEMCGFSHLLAPNGHLPIAESPHSHSPCVAAGQDYVYEDLENRVRNISLPSLKGLVQSASHVFREQLGNSNMKTLYFCRNAKYC